MKPFGTFKTGALAALFLSTSIFAANMPFPQGKEYGIRPAGSTTALANVVKSQYDRYVSKWYKSEGFISSPDTDGRGTTVSEAHGYGMMIFAIMDDKAKFDKMVTYYENNKAIGNLMQWRIGGGWAQGSATDGDLDIAFAFLLAETQWGGGQYLAKALKITDDILAYESNSNQTFLTLGDTYTDDALGRPSDWMAGHMRAFAKADNGSASTWNNIATEMYTRYNSFVSKNGSKGLISDFVKNGSPANGDETAYDKEYYTNAGRVPLRFAMDFARNKNTTNETAVKLITGRLAELCGNNPTNLKAGYKLDGTAIDADNGLEFLAPFGAGTIALGNQNLINDTWNELQQDWTQATDVTSFGDALKLMSMMVMSGNWWTYGDANTYKEPYVDTAGVVLDNFGNGYGDDNAQTSLGAMNGVIWGDKEYGGTSGDSTFYRGGGYWFAYTGTGASVKSKAGTIITDKNSEELVTDNKLDVVFSSKASDKVLYDYAAVETGIIGTVTKDTTIDRYVDLSKLTGITIQYNASADLKLVIATKDDREVVKADADGWIGNYLITLPKTTKMERKSFAIADLLPEADSPLAAAVKANDPKLTKLKNAIAFSFVYGEDADKGGSASLQVEDIIFNGMTYADFGLAYREPTAIKFHGTNKANGLNVTALQNAQNVALSFNASKAGNASVALYSLNGRQIAVSQAAVNVGSNQLTLNTESVATGLYVMRLSVNGAVSTSRISISK